ncbi:hypothetical protein [Arthrobacter sp. UYCu712]|uniref:hypothetical protein n=1 Tax=Arthrobacter sp. UYCu712 TaxID=3156340 RepID=UPI00339690D5
MAFAMTQVADDGSGACQIRRQGLTGGLRAKRQASDGLQRAPEEGAPRSAFCEEHKTPVGQRNQARFAIEDAGSDGLDPHAMMKLLSLTRSEAEELHANMIRLIGAVQAGSAEGPGPGRPLAEIN